MINIEKIEPFISNKDLNLWEYTRELLILEKFEKKGANNMTNEREDKPLNRRERFIKYREKRLSQAVHAIKLCENMANKNSYDYNQEEARTIIKHLQDALSNLKHAFSKVEKDRKFF